MELHFLPITLVNVFRILMFTNVSDLIIIYQICLVLSIILQDTLRKQTHPIIQNLHKIL